MDANDPLRVLYFDLLYFISPLHVICILSTYNSLTRRGLRVRDHDTRSSHTYIVDFERATRHPPLSAPIIHGRPTKRP